MSSDFYFKTWRTVLKRLEALLNTDIEYQTVKAHDQQHADAVYRLTAVLGQYMILYNEAVECLHNNLQVQKTEYMEIIVKAIVARILELKKELLNLEGTHYQFLGDGLALFRNTTFDAEMTTIPFKTKRSPPIQAAIENAFQKVKEIKEKEALAEPEEEEKEEVLVNPFDIESLTDSDVDESQTKEDIEDNISAEARVRKQLLAMIMAHEKLRQVTRSIRRNKLKRENWEKELLGTAQPPARYELRVKSAKLIQRVFRAHFELKRKLIENHKLDQILGLNYCKPPNPDLHEMETQRLAQRSELYNEHEKEWISEREKLKSEFILKKGKEVTEDYRDRIREWFYEWFDSIQFIHDIPNPGGITIFREEVPEPDEWLEEYKALMKQKEASKGKTPQELKYEAKEKKRLELKAKREEQKQKKADAALLKKMMKHPTMHPGYYYPQSKRTNHLLEALENYHLTWDFYDVKEIPEVKDKYVHEINIQDAYKDAKFDLLNEVDEDMNAEHQKLKNALREDYKNNEEKMPEQMTKRKSRKKTKKIKAIPSELITDKIEALALQGCIIDYPKTKLKDYIGDPNFIGEDLRRLVLPASPYCYEVRALWWEKCQDVGRGFNKILLVGPDGCGKITLVHALASMNDAVLFELDPVNIPVESLTEKYLKKLIKDILTCAKAVQPSVVHIRHVQKLFYAKVPPEEAELQLELIKKFFIQQLFKKINKFDKITIIGTCTNPWLARSTLMMKKFPLVILLPHTSYSTVVELLKGWVMKHTSIPCNFNIGCLAWVLQGYSFGCLQDMLNKFMSAERIVRTAGYGLTPMDVYNFILEDQDATKTEYDRYLKWYCEKTPSGKKEKQHIDDLLEFKEAVAVYEAKKDKKAKAAKKAAAKSGAP